jgi:SAM-dependent methyltransferase
MTVDQSRMEFFKQMFSGSWITQGIWVAAELGIADLLIDGPRTAGELAEKTHTNGNALYRVLRALASVGIFAEDAHGRFSLTPLADLLRTDASASQRPFAIMMGAEFHGAWGELLHSVRAGEPGFEKKFGVPFFQYMTERPERGKIYDAAMTGVHGGETEPMLDAYDFSPFQTVIDIGGGNGLVLAAILQRHPTIKGILFDLPAVADRARSIISGAGLSDRCQIVGGDFFSSVPVGGDAYVMRHIIHDWDDDEAIAILRNCREAMNPEGRILVVETVIPPGNEPCFGKWLDLMMLVVGGRERTEEQYRRLFSEAGLKLNRIVPTALEISVIEGVYAA